MRILHVIGSIDPTVGGPAIAALQLCQELARRGQNVSLYTTNATFAGNGRIGKALVPTNVSQNVNGVKVSYFSFAGPRQYSWSRPMLDAIRRQVKTFDVVHIHSLYLFHSAVASYYCRRNRVPFIVRPHGTLDPYLRRRHRSRKWIYELLSERQSLAAASVIHFTSAGEMQLALGSVPLNKLNVADRCRVVPNGIVIPPPSTQRNGRDYSEQFLARFPQLNGKQVVLFLGRLNFKKGLDILAKAFAKVCRILSDVHLVIAGPDNEGYGRFVRQWLATEGILHRTTFAGMLLGQDKAAAFGLAKAFVLPSYSENFAVAAVEAMAHSLAIIISNRVNIWPDVANAGAGIVVDCDPDDLANAIVQLIKEPERRIQMGEAGRQLALAKFNWDTVADHMLEVYRSIASEHSPSLDSPELTT
ncbi:MAG TPA: glycosyltransferase [Candidatus Binataceae bacterium]|nr:glycosyltransferase [Candidatus Binataceae bacterium]